ncbi:MAG: hypothetical protein ACHQRL_06630 [Gemmatimonadales bacterium]|jgi:hypothetical protein
MPYVLQQQAAAANPSAADIAAQVRAQVQQQLQDAGLSAQKAKAVADRAAQGAKSGLERAGQVNISKNGSHVVIDVPDIPQVPLAPLAPIAGPAIATIPPDLPLDIPPRIEHLGYAFLIMLAVIAVGKPLARALGSLIERRALKPAMPAEFGTRLERIEQGIESVSIEVERISEAQRYLLKVQTATPERIEATRSAS